jgi:hypothetical protein
MRHASFDARHAGEDQADIGLVVVVAPSLSRSASSRSSGSAAGVVFAVDGRGGAAALALPGLVAFLRHIGGEQKEADRDEAFGVSFAVLREPARPGEAPHDDH